MKFDRSVYHGYIIKGQLRNAISYVERFPEEFDLYTHLVAVFENKQYVSYDISAELNHILLAYQQYYRDSFYLCQTKDEAERKLKDRILKALGIKGGPIEFCVLEQNILTKTFQDHGYNFLGGKTSGYYGPYVWKTTETVSYDVELPDGTQKYSVKLLDGFISKSWIDYLSFGEIATGGWTDGDGYINCIKAAWDINSESFRVSLLKHEAQHVRDLQSNSKLTSELLEYRAKLVELIYSKQRNLLEEFSNEADNSDKNNGHSTAAYKIISRFKQEFQIEDLTSLTQEQIMSVAKELFNESTKKIQ